MSTLHNSTVVELRSKALERAEAKAKAFVILRAREAKHALARVEAGDIDAVHTAYLALGRAVRVTLRHGLRTERP